MTKIKFCGMTRSEDIELANKLKPNFVGFVFAKKSKRCITFEKAGTLKEQLLPDIKAVGVFVNEEPECIANLLNAGVIDAAQLHGNEDDNDIQRLKALTDKPLIQAFLIQSKKDLDRAEQSLADMILLDAGAGSGTSFDWKLIKSFRRPYFLAGGLTLKNVSEAINKLHPYGVDVSSGIEMDGSKNKDKMTAFMAAVRRVEQNDGK